LEHSYASLRSERCLLLSEGFSDPTRGGEGNGWIGDYTGNTWAGPNYFVAA